MLLFFLLALDVFGNYRLRVGRRGVAAAPAPAARAEAAE
jgi:hypothetical protein